MNGALAVQLSEATGKLVEGHVLGDEQRTQTRTDSGASRLDGADADAGSLQFQSRQCGIENDTAAYLGHERTVWQCR